MSSFPFSLHDNTTDHLKILNSYLTTFPSLTSLHFTWLDAKGPSPLSSDQPVLESLLPIKFKNTTPSSSGKPTSDDPCPRPPAPPRKPLKFHHLQTLILTNATLDAPTTSTFIRTHRRTLEQVDFDHCDVVDGTWEDAFGPLLKKRRRKKRHRPKDAYASDSTLCGPEEARDKTSRPPTPPPKDAETMEVPIVFRKPIVPLPVARDPERLCDIMWSTAALAGRRSRLLTAARRVVAGWFGK